MDACIVLAVTFIALAYVLSSSPTLAQQISQTSVPPVPTHKSVTIVIGNKFQQVLNEYNRPSNAPYWQQQY
jgi:hypothetical protein